jgi:TolA-binding protein
MCYIKRAEWPLAQTEFQIVTTDFVDSPRLADAHYWLGTSYWKQARPRALRPGHDAALRSRSSSAS